MASLSLRTDVRRWHSPALRPLTSLLVLENTEFPSDIPYNSTKRDPTLEYTEAPPMPKES